MGEITDLTASEAGDQIARKELSPVEITQACIDRIERLEPRLRAWETIDRAGALASANRLEAELADGERRGPLHGIPVGLKDIYFTNGMRTTMSSRIYANFVPEFDAAAVERLREAGAVILGKTVTTEFATGDPPVTKNPWDPRHTPGGSSSGSAVAVAGSMCPIATGSQTAGSVNRPAAYNGVVGLKPTFGRVSRFGVFPVSWSLDTLGWMTRDVRDAAMLLDVLSGYDPRDPASTQRPGSSATMAVDMEDPAWTPRIGVVAGFFANEANLEVKAHIHQITQALSLSGARMDFFDLPDSAIDINQAQAVIDYAECAMVHEAAFSRWPNDYAPNIRARIECGQLISASAYVQAQRLRRRFRADVEMMMGPSFDVLLTAATPSPAPRDLSTTGDPMFQAPWTTAGLPVLNIPTGLSEAGLPLGIQLIANGWDDPMLLRAGMWVERTLGVQLGEPSLTQN